MVGLGETKDEVIDVFNDLVAVSCDFLTIGQYLSPSKEHLEVNEYITPETFKWYEQKAYKTGFNYVASSPLVRSSYMAHEALLHIKE
jgi:lipoic acid synthetase